MLTVYFTVDVEIWCKGWDDIDSQFNGAFKRCIYGPARNGAFGLPVMLRVLNDAGVTASFFVEPLFSLRFGSAPLAEITGHILEARQPVELHLHSEWADEGRPPPLPHIGEKRPHLNLFSRDEQAALIGIGKNLLLQAGAKRINAFRAGNFSFNTDTLSALGQHDIRIDCSYNATFKGRESGLMPDRVLTEPLVHDGVTEVPITVYFDRPGHLRHTQLCACSSRELEGVLWKALEEGRRDVLILTHNTEFLCKSDSQIRHIVIKRFRRLCAFLDKNRDCFTAAGFSDFSCDNSSRQPLPLTSPIWKTGLRYVEQLRSRLQDCIHA